VLDSRSSWVDDEQLDEGKLLVALARRKVVGENGATARLRRMCSVFFSEAFVSLVCVVEGKEGAAARAWRGSGLGFAGVRRGAGSDGGWRRPRGEEKNTPPAWLVEKDDREKEGKRWRAEVVWAKQEEEATKGVDVVAARINGLLGSFLSSSSYDFSSSFFPFFTDFVGNRRIKERV
jgi:hypothetical protein